MKDWTHLLTDEEKVNVESIITKMDIDPRPTINKFLSDMQEIIAIHAPQF